MKSTNINKKQNGKYHFETITIAEYDESDLRKLYFHLQTDLNECKRQQQRLIDWENELKEQIDKIGKLIII